MTDRTHPDSGRIITSGDVLTEMHDRIAELEQEVAHTDGLLAKANALASIRAHHIAELEAQLEAIRAGGVSGPLVKGFDAADMATASAQGFRDGVASVAATAGSEPVATVFTMEALAPGGGVKYHATVHKPLPAGTKLYTHLSPPEGMVGGWISVKERLPPPFEEVVVYPRPDDYCCEAFCDTAGKWKWAEYEHNFGVHHRECQVEYWLMLPEAPAPPTTSAGSGKGE